MSLTQEMKSVRDRAAIEEDKSALRYGAQVANEEILRVLLGTVVRTVHPERRRAMAAGVRALVEKSIGQRLLAAEVADGIEAEAANDVVASVFDTLLAADALPSGAPA